MSKKIISIICITFLFSILFYKQHVGINFLLFTITTIGFFIFQDKSILKDKNVLLLIIAALFPASFAVIHGSTLTLWSTFIALLVLPGAILNKHSNVLLDFSTSIANIGGSPIFLTIEAVSSGKKGKGFLRLLKYLVPIVFIIAFFFIYRAMNPLFEKLTEDIAELISLGFILFTLLGFIVSYAIYNQQRAKQIDNWERNWELDINKDSISAPKWNEVTAFILLFIVLNLMLIAVNFMDINYLYLRNGMPEGITHKQFLHKGIGMLILSILLGISILLYFFRSSLNFSKNKMTIKLLAFLWVMQNVFMVVSTTLRNNIYVDDALLSYKRIGVYFWLFFALIGLITLLIKLHKNKTVWFLARHNFLALFIILIASSSIDWDMLISNFNINKAKQENDISSYDKKYLLDLSEGNISDLYAIKNIKGFEVDSTYSYSYNRSYHSSNSNWLDSKVYQFLLDDLDGDWRSYSARRTKVRKEIKLLDKNGFLDTLTISGYQTVSLKPFVQLQNLKELTLTNHHIKDLEKLEKLPALESLSVSYLKKEDLEYFKQLKSLKRLDINGSENEVVALFRKELPNIEVHYTI